MREISCTPGMKSEHLVQEATSAKGKTDSDINCINHLRYKISECLKKALSHVPGIILNTPVFFTSFTNTVGLHRAVLCMIVASFEYSVITRAGHFPTILHLNIQAHKKNEYSNIYLNEV